MGKWAERARQIESAGPRAISANSAKSPPIGTNDTIGKASAPRVLKFWHGKLSALHDLAAPGGFTRNEWAQLVEDACWLYENHAAYAVRHGWDAQGLFGIRIGMPEGGGLAQFLRSSRKVLFDGPIAHVTLWNVTSRLNPACGHGLPTIWEITE